MQTYYRVKSSQIERMIKQDYWLKLDKEGRTITPEMGKSAMIPQKKFIEDIKSELPKRDEVLKQVMEDQSLTRNENDYDYDSVDERHRQAMWSDDNLIEEVDDVVIKTLADVKWTTELEQSLEDALIDAEFNFDQAAKAVERKLNRELGDNFTTYKVDAKAMQFKWTEIEIRQH